MKNRIITSHLKFTNHQRTGIFLLFLVIVVLQAVYFFADFSFSEKTFPEKQQWMALQSNIDSLKLVTSNEKQGMHTFNPNFISDYKGYKLGMSIEEIDRLLAFRKENKYVNSAKEFQEVTMISDSLLDVISPFFKFPDWIQNKSNFRAEKKSLLKMFIQKKKR
nr:hypothetical protein [Flavobacterium sp. ASV13]